MLYAENKSSRGKILFLYSIGHKSFITSIHLWKKVTDKKGSRKRIQYVLLRHMCFYINACILLAH